MLFNGFKQSLPCFGLQYFNLQCLCLSFAWLKGRRFSAPSKHLQGQGAQIRPPCLSLVPTCFSTITISFASWLQASPRHLVPTNVTIAIHPNLPKNDTSFIYSCVSEQYNDKSLLASVMPKRFRATFAIALHNQHQTTAKTHPTRPPAGRRTHHSPVHRRKLLEWLFFGRILLICALEI